MRTRSPSEAIPFCLISLALASSVAIAAELPPEAKTRSNINMVLELHTYLMTHSKSPEGGPAEYRDSINAYREARGMVEDHAVWQLVYDACVEGPDIAAIRKLADTPPARLAPADRQAAAKVLGALAGAWPRFEASDLNHTRIDLQKIWVDVIRSIFENTLQPRVMPTVYEKMNFKPLDAPVTVYPVLGSGDVGAWGKTSQGYYLILPSAGLGRLTIVETLVHELTHLLDVNQPLGSNSFLKQLRARGAADPARAETLVHGLIAWNAGELIKRNVKKDHKTVLDLSASMRSQVAEFLPGYEGTWAGYLDGRLTAEQALAALAAMIGGGAGAKPKSGAQG